MVLAALAGHAVKGEIEHRVIEWRSVKAPDDA